MKTKAMETRLKRTIDSKEPDFRQACEWWADLPSIWTPIGWKDHMFRFNVLWNGTILAKPDLNTRTGQWAGQGLLLSVSPHCTANDDGMTRQGWQTGDAPALWTEWSTQGVTLRSEVFAHIPGGGDTQSGIEPLFAWVRLLIHDLCPALPLEESHVFDLLLQTPQVGTSMDLRHNISLPSPEQGRYPSPLKPDSETFDPAQAYRILEEDGKVRLAIAPGGGASTAVFTPPAQDRPLTRLQVRLPVRKGAYADLLVPMLPAERVVFDAELALGREAALRESRRYWKRVTACPARFETPEADVNEVIRHTVHFSNILTEKNPATGKYCKINGAWTYAALWTTPGAMDMVMLMDTLGHHDTISRYLEIFREEQGTVVPPGPSYELHPGFLSTPALYKSIDWLSDNGAVLYTICMHALLSGDRAFAERFSDCIVKSCEWIQTACAKTGHGGYEGVLPPAVATDAQTKIQAVWSIGWNYKGLCAAVRLLRRLGHPRAEAFAKEAEEYRDAFIKALRDKCRKMPVWRDARGRARRFVPTSLAGDEKAESRHPFYLDVGPLFLVFSGLMDARDPLMADTLAWFREGPQRKYYRRDSNFWQVPVLDHEMSSCEPCYSWNVFHTWQAGDRQHFLEGMYSLFAGSCSRQTRISCETRGGITGNVFSAPLAIYMARLAVIDDQLREDELHLLRLVPLAWLKPGARCRFEKIPTEFGPATLLTAMSADGKTLDVTFKPAFRFPPKKAILHAPPAPGLKWIRINGERRPAKGTIAMIGKEKPKKGSDEYAMRTS
jgi:hypothetical protein